ncbi:hypothetical protein LWI29_007508 [Acer saccharum]|uniref:DUF4219 domain-containing protein n=1 Tax=Acer saccharum TaxID=4024 RepID=A0AA39T0Q6_ACESA|nr:hypothetical protein LWI29_007508 [Acer saccharum]
MSVDMATGSSAALQVLQFSGENYQIWVVKMRSYLKSFGLWEYVAEDKKKGLHCRLRDNEECPEVATNLPSQDDQDVNITNMDEVQEHVRKKRGPTKMKTLAMEGASRIEVQSNGLGQLIGEGSARYIVNEGWQKDYIFKEMGELWRASKSRIVSKLRKAPNEEERVKLRPGNIKTTSDWKEFLKLKNSADFKLARKGCSLASDCVVWGDDVAVS